MLLDLGEAKELWEMDSGVESLRKWWICVVNLKECGVDTRGMSGDKMREILGSHPDFKYKKSSYYQMSMAI